MSGAEPRIRRRVVVSGRVQGVFFRGATQEAAVSRGVDGWVRNLPDGRVEAVFEGEATAVEALVEFCRHGPRGARVEAADVRSEPLESLRGFAIRR